MRLITVKEVTCLISIIIPVYNAELHLSRCLDSIIRQSFKSFEIILIDDGSTDNSKSICEKYTNIDNRISVIFRENQGPGPTRNLGMEVAKGDYIYFVDADDILLPNALADNYKLALENDLDVVIFSFEKIVYKSDTKTLVNHTFDNYLVTNNDKLSKIFWELADNGLMYAVWNKFYKKSFIMANDLKFTDCRKSQDAMFNFDVFQYADRIFINHNIYYQYHFYENNNITSRYTNDLYEIYKLYHKKLKKLLISLNLEHNTESMNKYNELLFIHTSVCFSNVWKLENNILSLSERIKEYRTIFKDEETLETLDNLKITQFRSFFRKISFIVMKTKNTYINLLYYRIIRSIKSF